MHGLCLNEASSQSPSRHKAYAIRALLVSPVTYFLTTTHPAKVIDSLVRPTSISTKLGPNREEDQTKAQQISTLFVLSKTKQHQPCAPPISS